MQRIIILANGKLPDIDKTRALLKDDDYILCADGGTRHAFSLDLKPALVIGDMDSIDRANLQKLQADGTLIELYPQDKNETDLELSITRALAFEPKEIIIVAASGGRLDQTLANIALLAGAHLADCDVRLDDGVEEIFFCRNQIDVHGRSGDIISLIPWGGEVTGIRTENLKWRLSNETLYPEKTRGISNEMTDDIASVKILSGMLLIVHTRRY